VFLKNSKACCLRTCDASYFEAGRSAVRVVARSAMGVGVGVTLGLMTAAPGAVASDGSAWMRSILNPGAATTTTASYNRSFVREWEANPPRGYATLSRDNIEPTQAAVKRYEQIVTDGGWSTLPEFDKLEVGMSHRNVRILHDRLLMSGDLAAPSHHPEYYDHTLEKAVRRYQASNGLTPTGIVDRRTRLALNVPARVRLAQLRTNLARLRAEARSGNSRYVIVNIPAAQIEAVENDRVYSRHTGVVGKIDRQTPILSSNIHELNFNPVWRLPPTVVTKDLIPKGREMQGQKQSVLLKYGIDAYDGSGRKLDPTKINWRSSQPFGLSYRQQPGPDNPLGFVRINFHNSHAVYLHDTPSDRIFGRNFRAASSGCVRVSNVEKFVAWLLKDTKGWSLAEVERLKKSGKSKNVSLRRQVPLRMTYITAWATPDGVVQFRRDLYGRDGVGAVAAAY